GLAEIYAAALDALGGRARQDALVAAVAGIGVPLLLDAAVTSVDRARHALALGAARVVVALETLDGFETLRRICDEAGGERVAFSLDLRNGQPIVAASGGISPYEPPFAFAVRVQDTVS